MLGLEVRFGALVLFFCLGYGWPLVPRNGSAFLERGHDHAKACADVGTYGARVDSYVSNGQTYSGE